MSDSLYELTGQALALKQMAFDGEVDEQTFKDTMESLQYEIEDKADTAEAIGLMANAGIKSTQAGTSLRTIMTNLSGDVKICGANIGEVTVATTNADGSMRDLSDILADCRVAFSGLSESEKATAAESLVGKNAMSGFLALMNAGEGDINKLSGAINNCDGAAENMANTMNDNLEGQLTILKSALEELAISFGQILLPAIKNIVEWIQGFVNILNSMHQLKDKEKKCDDMMARLSAMRNKDIRAVDESTLTDISEVTVDQELPVTERIASYIKQVGNPYCYKSHGVVVKINFTGERRLEDCIQSCMNP